MMGRGGRVGWDSHREKCIHVLCNIVLLNKKGWDGGVTRTNITYFA